MMKKGGSKIALVRLISTCAWVWTLVCTQELGGSGGMLPQEIFFEFDAVRWLLKLFLSPNTTSNLCFSPGLVTGFWFTSRLDMVCMEIGVHRRFQAPRAQCERATHTSRSVSLILFQSTPAKNVCPLHTNLWSVHSQVSAALFYVKTVRLGGHGCVQMIRGLLACK